MAVAAAARRPKRKRLVMKDLQQMSRNQEMPNRSSRTSAASSIPLETARNPVNPSTLRVFRHLQKFDPLGYPLAGVSEPLGLCPPEAPLSLSPWFGGDEVCQHGLTFLCKIGAATVDCRIERVGCGGDRIREIANFGVSSSQRFQFASILLFGQLARSFRHTDGLDSISSSRRRSGGQEPRQGIERIGKILLNQQRAGVMTHCIPGLEQVTESDSELVMRVRIIG